VQAFASSQGAVFAVKVHPVPGTQVSSVQGLLSLQVGGVPEAQRLFPPQVSAPLHTLPSSQSPCEKQQFGMGAYTHPVP